MPPAAYVTCQPFNVTTGDPDDIGKDDLNALLYIVVTLLFYSMGIIIGIITYLKREQAEMEEDKMFDMYMQLKREPFNLHKKERVNQMALYLKQLEEQQAAREKIENWKTVDHHQLLQHHPSCRHVQQPNSQRQQQPYLCPNCSKNVPALEMRHSYDGSAPLAIPEGDWRDGGGGTALLCSLTLGVCEPLLTPDSIKRVAFPDSDHVTTSGHTTTQQCRCGTYKSAFRHSSPAVHYTLPASTSPGSQNNDQVSSNETKTSILKSSPQPKEDDRPVMFDTSDIELKEMRQFKYDEVKAVFQKSSVPEPEIENKCDSAGSASASLLQTIPSPKTRSLSVTGPPGKSSKLTRQFSHDPERKSRALAVHSPVGRDINVTTETNNEKIPTTGDHEGPENSLLTAPKEQQMARTFESSDKVVEDIWTSEDVQLQKPETCQKQYSQLEQCYEQQPQQNQQPQQQQQNQTEILTIPTPWSPPQQSLQHQPEQVLPSLQSPPQSVANQEATVPLSPLSPSYQDQQFPTSEQHHHQLPHPIDVRPKIFPTPVIPKSLSIGESPEPCATSSESHLPRYKKRLHDQVYDSWKKGNSQSVDIPELMRSGKLESPNKIRPYDRKSTPRAQPERRGALFFTQKALQHKDVDSPRSTAGRGQSKVGLLGRQESSDSANSRFSDFSEGLESPLLQRDNDSSQNNSSASSPAGSSTMSPPSKHQRRIPRLARSQTIDTSKLLQK